MRMGVKIACHVTGSVVLKEEVPQRWTRTWTRMSRTSRTGVRAVGQRRGVLRDLVGGQLRPYLVAMVMNRRRRGVFADELLSEATS